MCDVGLWNYPWELLITTGFKVEVIKTLKLFTTVLSVQAGGLKVHFEVSWRLHL